MRDRLHVGGQDRGARAFVLAPLARDLVGGDHRHLWPEPADLALHGLLVGRVGVGVKEADCDRLHPLGRKVRKDLGQWRQVYRMHLLAAVAHAPAHLATPAPRHERLGLWIVEIEEIGAVAARDLQGVAKTLGGDEPDPDSAALGQRVDDQRGAVREERDRSGIDPGLFHHPEHPFLVVRRGRVHFRGSDDRPTAAGIRFEGHEIGEGSPDVRCDPNRFPGHLRLLFGGVRKRW